jgi:mono/diheme cytochrome c family protein
MGAENARVLAKITPGGQMLKTILKWMGIVLAVIVVLLLIAVGAIYFIGQSKFTKTYNIQVENVAIPNDAASIERGKHLVTVLCTGCHGENLAGTEFFNDPNGLGVIHAKNLTRGKGGIQNFYMDVDFVRTLRHGVRPDGTSVFVMPAADFHYLSDQDLGDIIAYLRTLPPVNQEWAPKQFTFMGMMLTGLGAFDNFIGAEQIDQTGPRPVAPAVGVTAEYGGYLVRLNGCRHCHGAQLSGGKVDDPTSNLHGPNLTPGGELAAWSDADFIKTLRTGVTPSGHPLDPMMPWKEFGRMTDAELKAVFMYLQAQPKLPTTLQ